MYVNFVGMKSADGFSVNPIVVRMDWTGAEQLPVSAAASFCVEVFESYLVLLAALQQFEDQATSRLLIAALHGAIWRLGHNTIEGC